MAEHGKLSAQPREIQGKQVSKLRRDGIVPGIIYGPAIREPRKVSVDAREFDTVYQAVGATTLVDVSVNGDTHTVFIRDVQQEPIKRNLLHVEFYAPNLNEPIVATVAVLAVGDVPETVDGVVTHGRQDVEVRALPEQIPQHFEVDLGQLVDLESTILVSDLQAPEGVEILTPGDEMIARLAAPQPEEVEEPEPEEVLDEETGDLPSEVDAGAEPVEEDE